MARAGQLRSDDASAFSAARPGAGLGRNGGLGLAFERFVRRKQLLWGTRAERVAAKRRN